MENKEGNKSRTNKKAIIEFNYLYTDEEKTVILKRREDELLQFLYERIGDIVTINEILENAAHQGKPLNTKTFTVTLSNLRKKIEPDPKKPFLIKTINNRGYQLDSSVFISYPGEL